MQQLPRMRREGMAVERAINTKAVSIEMEIL